MNLVGTLRNVADAVLSTVAPPLARRVSEQPRYGVVAAEGRFELRDYAPFLVAEVDVGGRRDEAADAAFPILASYIFDREKEGGDGGEKAGRLTIAMTTPVTQAPRPAIAMTAPVTQAPAGDGWTVRFMMPSKWTLATLPKPKNPAIRLREMPARRMAVVRFSGRATEEAIKAQREALRAFMERRGLSAIGEPEYAYYDPPFAPPALRRNEIMIPVAAS